MVVLIFAGALKFYRPFLTQSRVRDAGTPAPAGVFKPAEFPVASGQQACMGLVTVTPDSRLAKFQLGPSDSTAAGGPPVELVLSAPGYRGSGSVAGGYMKRSVTVPIQPTPKQPVIATACFVNLGHTTVLLDGPAAGRLGRSSLTLGGRAVPGQIALTFLTGHSESLLGRLGDVFDHASNLTDGFVPPWGVWLMALVTAFGVPAAIVVAFSMALRETVDQV